MIAKSNLFLIMYVSLTTAFNSTLLFLGEDRLDAYVALNILSFYISYALLRPFPRLNLALKLLHATLLGLFTLIVAFRVLEVIGA
jgi:hypothetical protein